jgi:DNA/RNA-binding domain of Phe-tRNA-synthetase-like protein
MNDDLAGFLEISDEIRSRFPGVKVAYLLLRNAQVISTPPRQKKRARATENELRSSFDQKSILTELNIASWIDLYKSMDLDVTEIRPAQLELALNVLRGKNIPKINSIVDAANMLAITSKCPVGAFDLDHLVTPVMLRLSVAAETYVPLFCSEPETVTLGEIVYADNEGIFSRYSKDADRSKITLDTRNVLYVIDGAPSTEKMILLRALDDLSDLLADVAGENITIERGYVEA